VAEEANPNVGGNASDGNTRGAQLVGIIADDAGHFLRIANGVKGCFRTYGAAAQDGEQFGDSGSGSHTSERAALQHALDGEEQRVIETVGEGHMQDAAIGRGVRGNRASGFEKGKRDESAPRGMEMLSAQRKNRAAPLLSEGNT